MEWRDCVRSVVCVVVVQAVKRGAFRGGGHREEGREGEKGCVHAGMGKVDGFVDDEKGE